MTADARSRTAARSPGDALSAPSTVTPDFNTRGGGLERTAAAKVRVRVIAVA